MERKENIKVYYILIIIIIKENKHKEDCKRYDGDKY